MDVASDVATLASLLWDHMLLHQEQISSFCFVASGLELYNQSLWETQSAMRNSKLRSWNKFRLFILTVVGSRSYVFSSAMGNSKLRSSL
jgi:hypothetical protein